MTKEFNLVNSFTLECSFCGPSVGLFKDTHLNIDMLKVRVLVNWLGYWQKFLSCSLRF